MNVLLIGRALFVIGTQDPVMGLQMWTGEFVVVPVIDPIGTQMMPANGEAPPPAQRFAPQPVWTFFAGRAMVFPTLQAANQLVAKYNGAFCWRDSIQIVKLSPNAPSSQVHLNS